MTTIINRLRRRFRALTDPSSVDREMDAEMRAHIAMEAEELMKTRGLSREDALRQAQIGFGGLDRFAEEHRDARGVRWMHELRDDARYSVRALMRAPTFTVSAVLVIALAIGAAIAVFAAVDAVMLAHLPYPHDERLVRIFQQTTPTNRWTLSDVDLRAIESLNHSFTAVGAARSRAVSVRATGDAERLAASFINAGVLEALDVPLEAGRRLSAGDEVPTAPPVTVVSHDFAVRAFGSAMAAVGQSITIDGKEFGVVGVLRPQDRKLAMWRADLWPVMTRTTPTRRGPFGMAALARLRDGVTLEMARRDLAAISVRIFPEWESSFKGKDARLTPYQLRGTLIGSADRPMKLFSGAVLLVLIIAIANVASLSIVRLMRRWREISVRTLLGASRARLVRLVMMESVVLSLAGGLLGVAFGAAGIVALKKLIEGMPLIEDAHLSAKAIMVAVALALATGIAIGIVPAMRVLASDRHDGARGGTRAIGDGRFTNRVRSAFVMTEFALALPVLVAGALLLQSVLRLQRVNPGYDPRGVYTTRIGFPSASYADNAALAQVWTRLESDIARIPGVTSVGVTTATLPNDFGDNNQNFWMVGSPNPPGQGEPSVTWPSVDNGLIETLGIKLLDGRLFTTGDSASNVSVVLASRSWAARFSPGTSPIGREMIASGCGECPRTVVVGVIDDIAQDGLSGPREALYSPVSQNWQNQLNVVVKASTPLGTLERGIRDALRRNDQSAAAGEVVSLESQLYESVAQPRHWATILMAFASAALAMAAVGIFGLLSYAVALRRREIGVRIALGAPPRAVVSTMVMSGMRFAAVGAMIGLVLTSITSKWLRASLYEVSAMDVRTLLVVTIGLLGVGLVASWLPARGAAGIDPVEAMRPE